MEFSWNFHRIIPHKQGGPKIKPFPNFHYNALKNTSVMLDFFHQILLKRSNMVLAIGIKMLCVT